MKENGGRLARQKELALAALLEFATIREAARAACIGVSTLKGWLKLEDFQRDYAKARASVLENSIGRLCRVTTKAVTVLDRMMEPDQTPAIRLRAALGCISLACSSWHEADVVPLLKNIIDRAQQQQQQPSTNGVLHR
jgi:hypothetical protein